MKIEIGKVGFLESEMGRKSSSRLTIIICACICVFAAGVEGVSKVMSVVKGAEAAAADWAGVAFLVGALMLGNGALKAAQRLNSNAGKPVDTIQSDVNDKTV